MLFIPTTDAEAYLSSIYTNTNHATTCLKPSHAETTTCGNFREEDFNLFFSSIENTLNQRNSTYHLVTGFTTHLHNFSDEDNAINCGRLNYTSYDQHELDLLESFIQNKVVTLKQQGKLEFVSADELINMALTE